MGDDSTFSQPSPLTAMLREKSRRRRMALGRQHAADLPQRLRNDLLPGLELAERSVGELSPPARNVRRPDAAHIRGVANSIAALGFCVPVLIDGGGRVLDGWVRVEAARQLGLTRIPCITATHLGQAERRLLRIALNRLGEKGTWDLDELRLEIEELVVDEAPIAIAGFTAPEIDALIMDQDPEAVEQGPVEPDPAAEPIARPGDIFDLGPHRVACGDARDPDLLAILMAGQEARIVLTDVPYNVPIRGHVTGGRHREFAMASGEMSPEQFEAFNQAWMEAAGHHLTDGGVLGTFIDWRSYATILAASQSCGLEPLNLVVWSKTNAGMGSLYRSAHELLPLYKKGEGPHLNNIELGRHGRWRTNVWTYPGASSVGSEARKGLQAHPTVKPTAMLSDALLDLTGRGEVVLDPFLGSGSTLMAAEQTGRICRGVEIDPLYVDVVLRRYEAATGRKPVRAGSAKAIGPEAPQEPPTGPDEASAGSASS